MFGHVRIRYLIVFANISVAKKKNAKFENATKAADEGANENELPYWERVYVFRSNRFARGPREYLCMHYFKSDTGNNF